MDQHKIDSIEWYPPTLKNICVSYWARKEKFYFFGLQGFLRTYLKPGGALYQELASKLNNTSDKGRSLISRLKENYHGSLPLRIWAAREGEFYNRENILMRVEATDKDFVFLPDLLSSIFIRAIWYPSTVASIAAQYSELIKVSLKRSSDKNADFSRFMVHGFGQRSASSWESSILGGAAFLQFFERTDIYGSIQWLKDCYSMDKSQYRSNALSLDHSHYLLTERLLGDNFSEYIKQVYKSFEVLAIPVDSISVEDIVPRLKSIIPQIPQNRILILRVDSGDIGIVIPKILDVVSGLMPMPANSKGYKVLPENIRLMFTDNITLARLGKILDKIEELNYAVDKITFGVGTNILQNCSRDTYGVVGKITAALDGDEWIDIEKESKENVEKKGLAGRLSLGKDEGVWKNEREESTEYFPLVYREGLI